MKREILETDKRDPIRLAREALDRAYDCLAIAEVEVRTLREQRDEARGDRDAAYIIVKGLQIEAGKR